MGRFTWEIRCSTIADLEALSGDIHIDPGDVLDLEPDMRLTVPTYIGGAELICSFNNKKSFQFRILYGTCGAIFNSQSVPSCQVYGGMQRQSH